MDDLDFKVLKTVTENMLGKRFADKEYISKNSSDLFFGNGIHLVAKPSKNMKIINSSQSDRILGILENVDVLLTPKKGGGCCEWTRDTSNFRFSWIAKNM